MARGDVVRVDLPAPAGPPGREQFGERPAVIIQSDSIGIGLATVIVVPLTSNTNSIRFPGSIQIEPDPKNGLNVTSVALVAQIRAIDKRRIRCTVGKLSTSDMKKLDEQLKQILAV